jgi:hypothetical protein
MQLVALGPRALDVFGKLRGSRGVKGDPSATAGTSLPASASLPPTLSVPPPAVPLVNEEGGEATPTGATGA